MNLELEKQEKKTLFTVKKSNPSRRGDSLVIVTWIILGFGFASLIFGWNKIVGTNRELKSLRVYASSNPGVPNSKIGESYVRDLYNFYSYDSAYSRVLATDAFAIGLNTVGDEISRDTLNRFPRIFEVLNLRAKILEVTQRSDKATSLRKSALEVEPIFQESYLDYASNLLLNGKKDEAIQILNQGLKSSYETDRIKNLLKAIVTNPEVGNEVQHNLYGKGKVVSISDKSITVKFYNEGIGTMTFERERAPLAYVR